MGAPSVKLIFYGFSFFFFLLTTYSLILYVSFFLSFSFSFYYALFPLLSFYSMVHAFSYF